MATTDERRPDDELAELQPRAQAIAKIDSMANYLDFIPDEAFEGDIVVVSTHGHPRDIEERVERSSGDFDGVRVIPVTGSSLRYDGPLTVADRTGPNDLTGIGVRFTEFVQDLEGDEPWVVFDNVNVFMMYAEDKRVYRFMDTVVGKTRSIGARGVYFTVADAIKEGTYEKLRQLCDVEIDFR